MTPLPSFTITLEHDVDLGWSIDHAGARIVDHAPTFLAAVNALIRHISESVTAAD